MAGGQKRSRSSDDAVVVADPVIDEDAPQPARPSKKPRKETNASAGRSLFVRSLPATVTSSALTELFSEGYPLKHATVVLDPETKQSKGYGFVTFADAEDAERAKEEFNGHALQGRKIKVEIAEPRQREVGAKDGAGKRKSTISVEAAATKKARADKMADDRKPPKLIIRNLPWSINTPEKLEEVFRSFGKVKHSTLPKVKDTQAGFGFVVMRGRKNAEKALAEINGKLLDGRTLAVDWAVEKDVWEGQKKSVEDVDAESATEEVADKAKANDEDPDVNDDVANFMKNHFDELEDEEDDDEEDPEDMDDDVDGDDGFEDESASEDEAAKEVARKKAQYITDNSSTLFIRNLPFTCLDPELKEHFMQFGPVRYGRVVMDHATGRPKGTGFVCFFNVEDADTCFRGAPRSQPAGTGANAIKRGGEAGGAPIVKHSILEDENADIGGLYRMEGRVLQISHAVEKEQAVKLTVEGTNFRDNRDKDKRRLYLLSEGTVAAGTPLYQALAPSEVKMREDSATQRKKLIQNNPTLHLSLTRLSIRNLPRSVTSKDLKALAREAVVGFAKDVKGGIRAQLSKEEEARGGDIMRDAEKERKAKGKGIVRQSKIVFEGKEGAKVSEDSGAGRSRGYGFIEYSSHRWALMGLRWMNGHALESGSGKKQRLIVEFAIENAQVVERRKEKEAKARIRSMEALKAKENGEVEKKVEKKVLGRDAQMAKTRKGMKPGDKGRPGDRKGRAKGFDVKKVDGRPGGRDDGKKGPPARGGKPGAGGDEKKFKPGFAPGEEGRLARRAQIIAKKRSMRRTRKKGAA